MKTYEVTVRGSEVRIVHAEQVLRGDAWLIFRVGNRNVARLPAPTTSCREIKTEQAKPSPKVCRTFRMRGSGSESYLVEVLLEEGILTMTCTCPAGALSKSCKHRFSLMNGSIEGVVSDNRHEAAGIPALIKESNLAYLFTQLRQANSDSLHNAKHLSDVKKQIARLLGKPPLPPTP